MDSRNQNLAQMLSPFANTFTYSLKTQPLRVQGAVYQGLLLMCSKR